jgi:transposase
MLGDCGIHLPELDEWIGVDRREWQAVVGLARRARGRRRDFYRCLALRLAREHPAVVLEPLNLRAASAGRNKASGEWSVFSRHARAGKVVAASHELEQAIRWACARHATPVFELSGPSASTCAACGALASGEAGAWARTLRCAQCGAENDRHANAAACLWRMAQQGMDGRIRGYATLMSASSLQA